MAETWWLIENDDGSYRQVVTGGQHPSTVGEPGRAHLMDRRGDLTFETPDLVSGTWTDNMDTVRVRLLAKLEEDRIKAQDSLVSPGDGKKLIYAQKNAEQRDYYGNGATPANRGRFPAAYAEMDVTGDKLAAVMTRFKAGADQTNGKLYRFDALAKKAKKDIQSATTAAKAEAALQVDWS
jgi:hypothetical protein